MTKEEANQRVISKERTTLEKYVAAQLFELGAELAGHKEYSFNRGVNVGMTKAYEDILEKLHNLPSLPSNLDEAAINRMHDPDMYLSDATIEEIGDALLKMAHFGAEWMAKQMMNSKAKTE